MLVGIIERIYISETPYKLTMEYFSSWTQLVLKWRTSNLVFTSARCNGYGEMSMKTMYTVMRVWEQYGGMKWYVMEGGWQRRNMCRKSLVGQHWWTIEVLPECMADLWPLPQSGLMCSVCPIDTGTYRCAVIAILVTIRELSLSFRIILHGASPTLVYNWPAAVTPTA